MKKIKKIFIGILSMVLLVGGTVNNTIGPLSRFSTN